MDRTGVTSKNPIVIDLSSDESEPDQRPTKRRKPQANTKEPPASTAASSSRISPKMGLGGMPDRAQIEAERLARARAREELQTQPSSTLVGSTNLLGEATRLQPTSSVLPEPSTATAGPSRSTEPNRYWKAEVKLSYNRWHPQTPNALRAEDIISPVSSFFFDLPTCVWKLR